jgi:hypothetical protein
LEGLLVATELPPLQEKPKSFNSMRELNWARFSSALTDHRASGALARLTARSPDIQWRDRSGVRAEFSQGHSRAFVLVRRGQQKFREHLLANQGEVCAFTGGAPARVLEAGRLYSYAELGTHYEHGGLMLRRDVHRLFDDGMLAVEPSKLRVDVALALAAYPQYAQLHDRPLSVAPRGEQVEWLGKHWEEHRSATAT